MSTTHCRQTEEHQQDLVFDGFERVEARKNLSRHDARQCHDTGRRHLIDDGQQAPPDSLADHHGRQLMNGCAEDIGAKAKTVCQGSNHAPCSGRKMFDDPVGPPAGFRADIRDQLSPSRGRSEARSRSFSQTSPSLGSRSAIMRRKKLLPDPDGPVIASRLPIARVSSNGPAISLRNLLTISAGDIHPLRPAGAHLRTSRRLARRHQSAMRVSLSAIACSLGAQTGGEVGGLTKGSEGVSIAPALDKAAAVIILAIALSREVLLGPKSSKRIPAVLAIATITATITGLRATFRCLL